jgi:hypothetical protein
MADQIGICALTGQTGRFVRSHLIPRALTQPRPDGKPFPQVGNGERPIRRQDSWYDTQLVVQAGEDILTGYDTFAITEFRTHKLIWQSWGPMQQLTPDLCKPLLPPNYGLRRIGFSNPTRVRLFLLSLLWRAARTKLRDFGEIQLESSDLRRLRAVVRDGTNPSIDFFPATLIQLSTYGPPHNFSPIAQTKHGVYDGQRKHRDLKIIRFYFDGLIIHFHSDIRAKEITDMTPFIVGAQKKTMVSTVRTEVSWQMKNLLHCISDADKLYPGILDKINRTSYQ